MIIQEELGTHSHPYPMPEPSEKTIRGEIREVEAMKKENRTSPSDWMDIEEQRGILGHRFIISIMMACHYPRLIRHEDFRRYHVL